MKRSSRIFLQIGVVLLGVAALGFMLWEPNIEGRNARSTLFEVYFNDPFLAFAYVGSIPFFAALVQAFKLLGYAGHNALRSPAAVKAVRTIRYCAIALIGFVAVGEMFILLNDSDDRAGGVFIGMLIASGSVAAAMAAAMFERVLKEPS